jgi:Heparinase II/III-like protein
MEGNSDFRCHEFPYVKNAWKWFLHMQMPGGRYVNCFDSMMGTVPSWALRTPLPSLISAALGSRDPDALSQVSRFFPVGDASLTAVRYQLALSSRPSVTLNAALDFPTYAHFPTQALAVWRSVWEAPADQQTAMGVWVRGGSLTDSHSHRDQGQVSVYSGVRPILIEAGTPSYADPQMETKYAAAAGHSIMQVAELCPRGQAAVSPLAISRLNADGGRITVDTSAAYLSPVRNCTRTVEWSRSGLVEIFDTVNFDSQIQQGTEVYRFHTGARTAVTLIRNAGGWLIDWNDASMEISSDASFEVVQSFWPDADSPGSGHVMLSIVSSTPLTSMNLSTRVLIKNP